jgi:hypothetical protein
LIIFPFLFGDFRKIIYIFFAIFIFFIYVAARSIKHKEDSHMTVIQAEVKPENILNTEKVDANVAQQKIDPNLNQQQTEDKPQKSAEDDENFKAFREGRKKDRLEREAAERRAAEKEAEVAALKAAMDAAFAKQPSAPSPAAYQQYYGMNQEQEESEDQKIEKKVNAIIAQREASFERQRAEREAQEYPARLEKDLPDFHQVISQENRDYLDYHYPEISRPLSRLQDGYEKWSDVYHAIKKFVPNQSSSKRDMARADLNQKKPGSISSATVTQPAPMPGSHVLSDEKKAANWERMRKTMASV